MNQRQEFPSRRTQAESVIGLASPKDRLAAAILDCCLVLPLVQIAQSPFRRWMLESYLFDEGILVSQYRLINIAICITVFIFYSGFCTYFKGQTLGQTFFRIKVISYHGRISLHSAFLRSFAIFLEFLFFGIPFLSAFSHPMRRPIHDRVADTLVIGMSHTVGFPLWIEKWRSYFVGFSLSFAFLLSLLFVWLFMLEDKNPVYADDFDSCKQQASSVEYDLEASVELFLVKRMTASCLYTVARDQLWEEESPLAYLAMSMATASSQKESDQYLTQVCAKDQTHPLCQYSQWVFAAQQKKKHKWGLNELAQNDQPDFMQLILASHMLDEGHYEDTKNTIIKVKNKKILQPLVASIGFFSLLGQDHLQSAFWVLQTHAVLSKRDVIKFIKNEYHKQNLPLVKKIEVLEFFYPSLGDQSQRGLASEETDDTNDFLAAKELYDLLKEEL